jgi:hydrogenase maturation protease
MSDRKPIVVIGLGHFYMSDDGVGVRVVRALQAEGGLPAGVEVMELGAAGFEVLHAIRGREHAILVDCAYMDVPPGECRCFSPEDARSRKVLANHSLHEGDLMQVLNISRWLEECPPRVTVVGIQPGRVGPGENLSPPLRARMGEYLQAVREAWEGSAVHA